jgi:2-polyprenyl-6-methoxyphenol hydroxylase-like FAD-dependent oxidoreductase
MRGEHAVVLGASMAGLLAARVLTESYERVTVVERDVLPPVGETRRGVPQGRHAHLLLSRGAQALDDLFPGFLDALVAEGVPHATDPELFQLTIGGHLMARTQIGEVEGTYQVSRARLEGRVLERVRALPTVGIREGYDVVGLVATGDRVTGARIQRPDAAAGEEVVPADLVVAATGRSGRTARWLQDLGFDPPPEEELKIDLMYVTCLLRMPPDALGTIQVLLSTPLPDRPTSLVLMLQEAGVWVLSAAGYGDHHPPTDWPALLDFVKGQVQPTVVASLVAAERLTEPHASRYPAQLRRRYDRLRRFPTGLVVTGDATCSFNPIYGQGMTVAALEAMALRKSLASQGDDLARRFHTEARKVAGTAWRQATAGDLTLPVVPGRRTLPMRLLNRYVGAVQAAAEQDPAVTATFLRVTALTDPPSRLLSPGTVARVVRARHRRTGTPRPVPAAR